MSRFVPVLILILCSQTQAHADVDHEIDEIDGVWNLQKTTCLKGRSSFHESSEESYMSYQFDRSRHLAIGRGRQNRCTFTIESQLKIERGMIYVSESRLKNASCGKFEVPATPPVRFEFRELPTGERALILISRPGDFCTENGVGEMTLVQPKLG